ncbi:MAG: carboxypeptidase-like regulatory domain-containing protein [Bacteroidia bacterium]
MKKLLPILIAIFFYAGSVIAGNDPVNIKVLSGKVIDKQSGEALAGVKIQLKDTDKYCYTDMEGNFTLTVTAGNTNDVTVDMVGYKTSTLKTYQLSLGADIALNPR